MNLGMGKGESVAELIATAERAIDIRYHKLKWVVDLGIPRTSSRTLGKPRAFSDGAPNDPNLVRSLTTLGGIASDLTWRANAFG
jgi:hypothetical protein